MQAHVKLTVICTIVVAVASAWATSSYADSTSVCPPVMGDRSMMLGSLRTLGTNRRMAELGGVPKPTINRKVNESLEKLMPCLRELGVSAKEIEEAIASGEPDGEAIIKHSEVKELQCEQIREEY